MAGGCKFSNCDYFCFSEGEESFHCGCPDKMIYNQNLQKCECENLENCESNNILNFCLPEKRI